MPDSRNIASLSATISMASRRRKRAVGAPVTRQFHGGALEIAPVLFELGFKAREQREGIGGRSGKAGENAVVVQPTDLARALFHHRLSEGDLAVAGEHGVIALPDRKDCG